MWASLALDWPDCLDKVLSEAAGEWLRDRLLPGGGGRSNGCPGEGDRLTVGLAGIVSRTRPWVGLGLVLDITVCQDCGSTADVSHESKPSSAIISRSPVPESSDGGRKVDFWTTNRVLEEMGLTTWENEERNEFMVSEPDLLRPEIVEDGDSRDSLPLEGGAVAVAGRDAAFSSEEL